MPETLAAIFAGFSAGVLIILMISIGKIRSRSSALWRMEGKLDLLLKSSGMDFDPYTCPGNDVLKAVESGDRLLAIKLYRHHTDSTIVASKEFVTELERRVKAKA